MQYRVLRQMDGDRQYFAGDVREMVAADAAPLLALGVIEKIKGAPVTPDVAKAKRAPLAKALVAPENKVVE